MITSVYDAPAALRFAFASVMSTSREMENCGCSRTLVVMRSAMARRIRDKGSLFSLEGVGAGATGEREAAASTSSRVTRPPGPLPLIPEMSTPSSCARLRAAGDDRTRSPSEDLRGGPTLEGARPGGGAAAQAG